MKIILIVLPILSLISCTNDNPPNTTTTTTTDSTVIIPDNSMVIGIDTDDHNTGSYPTNTLDSAGPVITPKDTASSTTLQ